MRDFLKLVQVNEMAEAAEYGGCKFAGATVIGSGVYGRLKYESGIHRVQRVPATEASGRLHTSAASVAVLAAAEEVDISVREEDLRIDTFRSGTRENEPIQLFSSLVYALPCLWILVLRGG